MTVIKLRENVQSDFRVTVCLRVHANDAVVCVRVYINLFSIDLLYVTCVSTFWYVLIYKTKINSINVKILIFHFTSMRSFFPISLSFLFCSRTCIGVRVYFLRNIFKWLIASIPFYSVNLEHTYA